ncbi:acyl-coenzyme A diphosphatase NUDT19-like isoform X2 [Haematobia irritans]|uniref:acyl-coenzyme A diphosphatase NUDT19-like isoform X2 n=1 Tax=Haematobia irritans TaxID=7368 RepID=UPI003F504F23
MVILLAKRTERTAYAPDHYVFPGGVFDSKADENFEWLQHFQTFGISRKDLTMLCLEHLPNRPHPLMTSKNCFSRDISLRITAIREVFEEVGILLCRTKSQLFCKHEGCGIIYENFNQSYWQEKVHDNPAEFLKLCRHLNVVPDIWSLHEWSIWRSPPAALKKYDTVLYLVTLPNKPQLLLEPSEVEEELWISPSLAIEMFKERKIWLPPMLFFEISRLSNMVSWIKLKEFAKRRALLGCTLLMLAYYRCEDALVGTLPGDDFYPENILTHTETKNLSGSSEDFHNKTKNKHRLIYRDMHDISLLSNIAPIDNHLNPIYRVEVENSKL